LHAGETFLQTKIIHGSRYHRSAARGRGGELMRSALAVALLLAVASSVSQPEVESGKDLLTRRGGGWKNSNLTWNEDLLERWLTGTEALVPENDMSFRVTSRDERRDIIAYLKSLSHGTMSSVSGPP
jgi:hypothetical protein